MATADQQPITRVRWAIKIKISPIKYLVEDRDGSHVFIGKLNEQDFDALDVAYIRSATVQQDPPGRGRFQRLRA